MAPRTMLSVTLVFQTTGWPRGSRPDPLTGAEIHVKVFNSPRPLWRIDKQAFDAEADGPAKTRIRAAE